MTLRESMQNSKRDHETSAGPDEDDIREEVNEVLVFVDALSEVAPSANASKSDRAAEIWVIGSSRARRAVRLAPET